MKEEIAKLEEILANPSSETDIDQTEYVLEEYKYKLAIQEEMLETAPEDSGQWVEASRIFNDDLIEAHSKPIDNKQS